MGGIDKLLAPIGGRPLLAWTLAALAARARGRADRRRRGRRTRSTRIARRAVAAGRGRRRRRRAARAARSRSRPAFAALERLTPRTRPDERVVLVHDGGAAAVSAGAGRRGRDGGRAGTAPRSRSLPVAETLKRIDGGAIAATVDRDGARGRPDAAGRPARACCARRLRDVPAGRAARPGPTRPRCWRPVASPSMRPRRPDEPQGDRARRPRARGRARSLGRRPTARRLSATTAIRSGRASRSRSAASRSPARRGSHGHSDGDVALHAVADALLGAAGLGDLGRLVPGRTPARRAGIASGELLADVVARLAAAGLAPGLDRPHDRRRAAAARRAASTRCGRAIAGLLGIADGGVNVKASTGNLDGAEGAGRAISALGRRDRGAGRDDRPPARHADRRDRGRSCRSSRATSGSTAAGRPSTGRPTSATSGRSCSPTCSSATCASAAAGSRWVMNITDIDDKIIRGAAAAGRGDRRARRPLDRRASSPTPARSRMTEPDVLPRATEHIDEIVALIATLLERGHAYRTDDGSIFFRIASWPAYGRLARLDPDQLRVGERVEADEYAKDDVRDFALWKGPKPGEPSWETAIGAGPAGLAHRVLGDEHDAPRAVLRHPHRRRRPDLPAPRGRDRPERGRDRPAVRADLAPLRPPPDERREDGQVDRQHRPRRRAARGGRLAAGAALRPDLGPLPGRRSSYSDESLAAAGAAVDRLDAAVAALAAYREERAGRPRAARRSSRRARSRSRRRSTTTSTCRPALAALFDLVRELNRRIDARSLSTGGRGARARRCCATSTACSGSLPGRRAERPRRRRCRRCSTSAPRPARRATGPRRTGCATSSRRAGSPSRTRATASAGDGRGGRSWLTRAEPTRSTEAATGRSPTGRRRGGGRPGGGRPARDAGPRGPGGAGRWSAAVMAHASGGGPDAARGRGRRQAVGRADPTARRRDRGRGGSPTARAAPARADDRRPGPPGPRHGRAAAPVVRPARGRGRRGRAPGLRRAPRAGSAAAIRSPGRPRPPDDAPQDIAGDGPGLRPRPAVRPRPRWPAPIASRPRGSRRSEPLPGRPDRGGGPDRPGRTTARRSAGRRAAARTPAVWPAAEPSAPAGPRPGGRPSGPYRAGRRPGPRRTIRAACAVPASGPPPAPGRERPGLGRSSRPGRRRSDGPICSARGRGARRRPAAGRGGVRRRRAGPPAARRAAASPGAREDRPPRHEPADPDRRGRGRHADRARRLRRPPGRRARRRAAPLRRRSTRSWRGRSSATSRRSCSSSTRSRTPRTSGRCCAAPRPRASTASSSRPTARRRSRRPRSRHRRGPSSTCCSRRSTISPAPWPTSTSAASGSPAPRRMRR